MNERVSHPDLLRLTVEVVTAHASHNTFPAEALPRVIREVYAALVSVETDGDKTQSGVAETKSETTASPPSQALTPAVPVKNSVFQDYIVCLEDGKKLKMLKGHLQSAHGMTPQDYRKKWSLPETYPIVAPSHAALRSKVAKKIGFGQKRKTVPAPAEVVVQRIPEGVSAKRPRGRPKKV
jgi:predicted transcriptional regulator